jgi:hypothetical protein
VRFVWVVGTGRCGSSLVREILAHHPSVGFFSNVQDHLRFLPVTGRANGALYRALPYEWTRNRRVRFGPTEGYRLLSARVSRVLVDPFRDVTAADVTPWTAQRFAELFRSEAAAQGRPFFLHKFTGWPRARFIEAVLPGSLFVHVVRDGRAVANSFLQMATWPGYHRPTWGWGALPAEYEAEWIDSGRSFVVLAGLEWRALMDAFAEARSEIPDDRWLDVRHEDFVRDPVAVTREIVDFVGLPDDPRFDAALRRYPVKASRLDAFRRDLRPHQLVELERVLGPQLARWGYGDALAAADALPS